MTSLIPPLHLYHFLLQKPGTLTSVAYGNFSAPKAQELIVARGTEYLELLRPDADSGKINVVCSTHVFGRVRSVLPFRLPGSTTDHIVVGSDSGRIVVLEYNAEANKFVKIHEETYGRSGIRRVLPGQYLASDPYGRAVMIGSVEMKKFVYILNRDSEANLTISSPLSAHHSSSIVFDMIGVDVEYDNPIFACLELDYEEADNDPTGEAAANTEKEIVLYELDLGLNHVVRSNSITVDRTANMIMSVPGGTAGPGGIVVLAEDFVSYVNVDHPTVRVPIPRREHTPRTEKLMLTAKCIIKQPEWFFYLVQSEVGDLYKITLDYDEDRVHAIQIDYFDTVPIASSLSFIKTGFLFVAAESSNHALYQFASLGDEEDLNFSIPDDEDHVYFKLRAPKNLVLIDEMQSIAPVIGASVMNPFAEETPQLYMLSGKGPRSSLRILRHGVAVTDRAVNELPGNPIGVFTLRTHIDDDVDKYIIVSFLNATMVLLVGDSIEEVQDSGFDGTVTTLNARLLGEDSLIQIYPGGIRHIKSDGRINEWESPNGKKVNVSSINQRQVVVGLEGGTLVYFELDTSGSLVEIETRELEGAREITAVALSPVPKGRQRGRFLAVADDSNTVRVLSLAPSDQMGRKALLTVDHVVSSLLISELTSYDTVKLYLTIGTVSGVMYRSTMDQVTGTLSSNTRAMFLGSRPVKLFEIDIHGENAIMAMSSRSWLTYSEYPKLTTTPLSTEEVLEYVAPFCSEQCEEGCVAITFNELRIFTIERLEETFNQESVDLRYTPRRMITNPLNNSLLIIEADDATYSLADRDEIIQKLHEEAEKISGPKDKMDTDSDSDSDSDSDDMPVTLYGYPKAPSGNWASCLRILDIVNDSVSILELEDNECAVSVTTCKFQTNPEALYLVIGTVKDLKWYPRRSCTCGYLRTYLIDENSELSFVHATKVEDVPLAICEYQGRLAAGISSVLRLYDIGKKKLLRKCENKKFYSTIVSIWQANNRLVVGELKESFHFVKYSFADNQLYIFADDIMSRSVSCGTMLDATTLVGGDRFGNVFVLRLPENVNEEVDEDPTGGHITWGSPAGILGAPYKMNNICNFHVGEGLSYLGKVQLTPGASEFILYTTIYGTIGALIPVSTKEDIEFFTNLEMHMRQKIDPLCGRVHMAYRSLFSPVKSTTDGILCEQFAVLSMRDQREIADELERSPTEVLKKNRRSKVLYLIKS